MRLPISAGVAIRRLYQGDVRLVGWLVVGFASLLLTELVLRITGEESYPLSEAFWLFQVAVAGWAIHTYRAPFTELIEDFMLISENVKSAQPGTGDRDVAAIHSLAEQEARNAFSIWHPLPILMIVIAGACWAGTLLALGSPFKSALVTVLSYLFFVPMVVTGMWGSACVVRVLVAFRRTAANGLQAEFSSSKHPVLVRMEQRWGSYGLVIASVYFLVLAALWFGPYPVATMPLPIWLGTLAAVPLIWWLVGGFELHAYLAEIKRRSLEKAAAKVNQLSQALNGESSGDALINLRMALEIESRIDGMDEWPAGFDIRGFVVAVLPIAAQIAIVLSGFDLAI